MSSAVFYPDVGDAVRHMAKRENFSPLINDTRETVAIVPTHRTNFSTYKLCNIHQSINIVKFVSMAFSFVHWMFQSKFRRCVFKANADIDATNNANCLSWVRHVWMRAEREIYQANWKSCSKIDKTLWVCVVRGGRLDAIDSIVLTDNLSAWWIHWVKHVVYECQYECEWRIRLWNCITIVLWVAYFNWITDSWQFCDVREIKDQRMNADFVKFQLMRQIVSLNWKRTHGLQEQRIPF